LNILKEYTFIVVPIPENIYKWDRTIEAPCSLMLPVKASPSLTENRPCSIFVVQFLNIKYENLVDFTCSLSTVFLYLAGGCWLLEQNIRGFNV